MRQFLIGSGITSVIINGAAWVALGNKMSQALCLLGVASALIGFFLWHVEKEPRVKN